MISNQDKTYFYSANGSGVGGQIQRPFNQIIPVQAASSLPITGGCGSSRVEDFRFEEILSFKAAYTHVCGSRNEKDGSFTTLVSATVEGLNILEVVTADRVVARLSLLHPPEDGEPRIIPLGSRFDNLRIAGGAVDVELDVDMFCRLDTFEGFKSQYSRDPEFRKIAGERYQWSKQGGLPESKGIIACSLVKNIRTAHPEVKQSGHVLLLPQFGRILLAEILLERYSRRLAMLRLEMGSTVQGTISVGTVEGNGVTFP